MRNKKTLLAFGTFVFLFFILTCVSSAQQINVKFAEYDPQIQETSIPSFIQNFYVFALGVAGVLAVGMIVIGGIYFSISGAVDKQGEAKQMILGAVFGLLLLFASYIILRTINPRLVDLENPGGVLEEAGFNTCTAPELPFCKDGQQERSLETGKCQCRTKPANGCPLSVKQTLYSQQDAPLYTWVKEYENSPIPYTDAVFPAGEVPDISEESGCPNIVKMEEGTTPLFVTSVDTDGTFAVELKKQPKFANLSFPLPAGDYYGDVTSLFVSGKPNKALCVVTKFHDKQNSKTYDVHPNGLKNSGVCSQVEMSEIQNEVELEVKAGGLLGGMCLPGLTQCNPANLLLNCPDFGTDAYNASIICNAESSEDPNIVSGTDFCENEKNKPKSERHGFSMGLFQINVIANGPLVTRKSGDNSCEGLFDKTSGPKKNKGGWKTGFNCNFISGKEAQWERCRQILSGPAQNIKLACELYKAAKAATGNGLKGPWRYSYNKCSL